MTLTEKEIQKIIDTMIKVKSVEKTALLTKHSKTTVKNKLRRHNLLRPPNKRNETSSYSPYQQRKLTNGYCSTRIPQQNGITNWTEEQTYSNQSRNPTSDHPLITENHRLIKENTTLKQLVWDMIDKKDGKDAQLQNLTTVKEQQDKKIQDLNQQVSLLTDDKSKLSEKLRDQTQQLNQTKTENEKLERTNYQLNEQNRELKSEDDEKNQYTKNLEKKVQKTETELIHTKEKFNSVLKTKNEITAERGKLKNEIRNLNRDNDTAWIKYLTTGIIFFGAGTGLGWWLWGRNKNPTVPSSVDFRKDHIPYIMPYQPDNRNQPYLNSGLAMETNSSGILCIRPFSSNYEQGNGVGDSVIPNTQGNRITLDGNTEVTLGHPSSIPCLGPFFSSHIETSGDIPQVVTPIQTPSSDQIPINYFYIPLRSPLPDDLSEILVMRQMRSFNGIQFEKHIKKLFDHNGNPMAKTPYRDKGVDLYGKVDGKNTIIECKQKPKVEIDVIQRLYANKKRYKAQRFIVITTGIFTKDALEEAQYLGVECWDGKRLLQEIYKAQFFLPPE